MDNGAPSLARRLTSTALACLCALAGTLALGAVSASAALPTSFGERNEEGGAGQFFEPRGVAVDQTSGNAYLADTGDNRVDEFGPEGEFVRAWGWGVTNGASEFQTCTTACRPGLTGSGVGQFSGVQGVAVDGNGDVYVVDSENHRVEKFGPDGKFLLMFGKGVNVTSTGDVCEGKPGEECGPGQQGLEPGELFFSPSIAVDPSGTVYVGDYGRVEEFSEAGEFVGQFPVAEGVPVGSLAANASKEVYLVYLTGFGVTGVHRYDTFGNETGDSLDAEGSPQAVTLGRNGEVFVDNGSDEAPEPHLFEYDSAGNELASFDSGREGGSRGIAFRNAVDRVYVLSMEAVHLLAPPAPGPVVAGESVSELLPGSATLDALVNPEGNETSYRFEYGTSEAYANSTQTSVLSGAPFEDQHAAAPVTGLQPSTLYHFRVVASDSLGRTTFGQDEEFTTPPPVLIDSESVSQVTPESAQLHVTLNPQGSATEYSFEYGLTSAYGERAPVPDASAGEGIGDVSPSVAVEHLTPGSVYHYRVVAHNVFGTVSGPDQTFTTQTANAPISLADHRRWEMVSPPEKSGVSLEALPEEGGLTESSESGDALTYIARGALNQEAPGSRSAAFSQLLARRGAAGWSTQDITTPHDQTAGLLASERAEYRSFSPDLSTGVVEPEGATRLSPAASERTPYRREQDGEYVPLVTASNVPAGTKFGGEEIRAEHFARGVEVAGASPDAGAVAIAAPLALTSDFAQPEAEGEEIRSLYSARNGKLSLVSWLPGTGETPHETPAALTGLQAELGRSGREQIIRHAISQDGNRFVYTLVGASGSQKHLFSREMSLEKSTQLDMLETGTSGPGANVLFQDASADGRVVFFTDEERLTANATGSASVSSADLYECEIPEVASGVPCAPRNLTVPLVHGERADVRGDVVGTDERGDAVYFVADGRLTSDAAHGDCGRHEPAESAVCNLYVYDRGSDSVRLVAVLSGSDAADWGETGGSSPLSSHTARVSPNGRYMAFMSERSLTGYDNTDASSGVPDQEVYEYDAVKGTLRCASCNPTGARPHGAFEPGGYPGLLVDRTRAFPRTWLAAMVPDWTRATSFVAPYQARYLLNNGRLFFNSSDALVPQDVNGQWDVYELEPHGIGSCGEEAGCVAMMSSGRSTEETAFLDGSGTGPAGEEGEDVFFLTEDKLSPRDIDELLDVYDAHTCSLASPCVDESVARTGSCATIESCRSSGGTHEGILVPPPTSALSGAGNVPASPAKPAAKPPTRAQKLAKALNACKKDKNKKKRAACVKRANKLYGTAKKKAHKGAKKRGK
jgi:DNA-binding beta-propeller fold protein YncE